MQNGYLTNQLLIAMPNLQDGNFKKTVTYVCEHNEDGAMGIVINRPIALSLEEVFLQMEITSEGRDNKEIVYIGGPVAEERGFVLHSNDASFEPDWKSSLQVTEGLSVTTSRDILEAIATNEGPSKNLIALGYAGWEAGQLESEMTQNTWLSGPASDDILFKLPANQRWKAAAQLLGVDINLLSSESGHA